MWHIYTMEYYSAIKRNEIELFVVRCTAGILYGSSLTFSGAKLFLFFRKHAQNCLRHTLSNLLMAEIFFSVSKTFGKHLNLKVNQIYRVFGVCVLPNNCGKDPLSMSHIGTHHTISKGQKVLSVSCLNNKFCLYILYNKATSRVGVNICKPHI